MSIARRSDQIGSRRPETGALSPCRVGMDVRYLKRRGVGISRYVEQGLSQILEAGAQVTLITDDECHADALQAAFPSAGTVCLPGRSGFLWEQHTLRSHLATAGYDAYVAPANYGLPLTYRGSTVLILVVHDLIPLRLGHLYLVPRPLWAVKYLLSTAIAAARADQVVAPSHATAGDVRRLLRRQDVAVVYPPIPSPETGPDRTKATLLPDPLLDAAGRAVKPYFAYNGGADIRKNVPTLLRAFAKARHVMPDVDLVLLGSGQERFRRPARRLGLDGHVHVPGYVDEATKDAILHFAVAVVYPSRIEGFGFPVVEAMTAGVPAVCGTGGSLREVGGDAVTYVPVISDETLAAAMLSVTRESVRRAARSAGAAQLDILRTRQRARTLADVVAAALEERTSPVPSTLAGRYLRRYDY